ncbi:MAG TPA: glycosyltransferase [Anaeromyxobacteraceae bacterium]|nr:glycosyltransferase [Anaeromyxobacteraceae bacterium]
MATTVGENGDGQPADLLMIIPVRNEGERLQRFLSDLSECPPLPVTEFVVVDDASGREAAELQVQGVAWFAERMRDAGRPHRIRLVVAPAHGGKGAAIRLGWGDGTAARWLGFVDGDGAVPAREVWRLATTLVPDPPFDALLGSRVRAPGRVVRRHLLRGLQGAAFARAANALLRIGVADPQCGLKLFRADRLRPLLPGLRERGWTLDPELLLLLRKAGGSLREAPIDWTEHGKSKVVFGIDAVRMLWQVLRLRRRLGTATVLGAPPPPAVG